MGEIRGFLSGVVEILTGCREIPYRIPVL